MANDFRLKVRSIIADLEARRLLNDADKRTVIDALKSDKLAQLAMITCEPSQQLTGIQIRGTIASCYKYLSLVHVDPNAWYPYAMETQRFNLPDILNTDGYEAVARKFSSHYSPEELVALVQAGIPSPPSRINLGRAWAACIFYLAKGQVSPQEVLRRLSEFPHDLELVIETRDRALRHRRSGSLKRPTRTSSARPSAPEDQHEWSPDIWNRGQRLPGSYGSNQ